MKTLGCFFTIFSVILITSNITNATLIDTNTSLGHVIYDNVANQYWIKDLNAFTNQTYQGQINTITNMFNNTNYFGINTWHLAGLTDMARLWSNSPSEVAYFDTTSSMGSGPQSIGRFDMPLGDTGTSHGVMFIIHYPDGNFRLNDLDMPGIRSDFDSTSFLGAWVTASAPNPAPDPVPEPASFLLLSAGMVGLAGFRTLKKLPRRKQRVISQRS